MFATLRWDLFEDLRAYLNLECHNIKKASNLVFTSTRPHQLFH
jgi:hypothetical protein